MIIGGEIGGGAGRASRRARRAGRALAAPRMLILASR